MVLINTLEINPPLINASCAWACEYAQLRDLYDCPYIGAVTTRTATLHGWTEDETKTVVFDITSGSTLNNYGYSPHPLAEYLGWVYQLLTTPVAGGAPPTKPVLISLTAANPTVLEEMLVEVQDLRARLRRAGPCMLGAPDPAALVGVEFNTSCPNIRDAVPLAYNFPLLTPLLDTLANASLTDPSLTVGLKLPPYLYSARFKEVVRSLATYSRVRPRAPDGVPAPVNPFAYLECANTLGNSLMFADQAVPAPPEGEERPYALVSPLGGLGGEAVHALALGNVYSFASLLAAHADPAVQGIAIIGAGGVTSLEAASRMQRAGAKVVACATLLGREGVSGFERLFKAMNL